MRAASTIPVAMRAPAVGGAAGGGGPRFGNPLAVSIDHNVPSRWCWAAVTSAVTTFYASVRHVGQALSPCEVATNCLDGNPQCCPPPKDPDDWRNKDQGLEGILMTAVPGINYLAPDSPTGVLDFETIAREIDAGRPVCCFIAWPGESIAGHFIAIVGYDRAHQEVHVRDNKYIDGPVPYDLLCNNYQAGGTWQRSYKTQGGDSAV